MAIQVNSIRSQFPILHQEVNGNPLIYFDNAATTQKPKVVLDAIQQYYEVDNSNIHRGAHTLADRATQQFEETRESVRAFIGAKESAEIIFTRGTTESINLVAKTFGSAFIQKGDEIIISTLEHHSNIVPWQMLCEQNGAVLRIIPITDAGELIWEEFEKLLSSKTKLVSVVHASNALGSINPVKRIIDAAHAVGAKVLLDGAQSTSHLDVDVQALDCDFLAFSAHKLYGPTGLGVLYGKRELLEAMPPFLGGGEMIRDVRLDGFTTNDLPWKFEAGTPHISGAIGLGAAVDWLETIGIDAVQAHEQSLLTQATAALREIPGLRLIGEAADKGPVISFVMDGVHPHDLGTILDAEGVAVRAGHHCAMPVMAFFDVPATARASFGCYSDEADIAQLVAALRHAHEVFN